jgi:hypothetical protein
MPDNKTHRLVGVASATGICSIIAIPISWWLVVMIASFIGSPWPDHFERPMRWIWRKTRNRWEGRPIEVKLRMLAKHRWWTHWLIISIPVALLTAVFVILIGYLTILAIIAITEVKYEPHISSIAAWIGIFIAFGVLIGYVFHSLLDTCTDWGSPIFGPWCEKRIKILPKKLRIEERGATCLRWLSIASIIALLYFQVTS